MTNETPADLYIFTTDLLPLDPRFLPPLANGLLGWRVYDDIMHMGGVYNGEGGDCHRANLPCPLAVRMEIEEEEKAGHLQHSYSLDTHTGIFTHSLRTASVIASQSLYAHRHHPNLLVMEVLLVRQGTSQEPITVKLDSTFTPQSDDIVFHSEPDYKGGSYIQGQTTMAEVPGGVCPSVHIIWTPITPSLTLLPDQAQSRWGFVVAMAGSQDSAQAHYDTGLELMANGNLRPSHLRAWEELWAGSTLELTGPDDLSRALIGCMFYLLSAFPSLHEAPGHFGGVSPGGLSNGGSGQDYWGHVFWDQDTWMYPSIGLFYPQLARAVLEYRVRTVDGAKDNAEKQGYKGLKFPWESAVSGREVCPEDIYGQQEIHINGDVTLAFQHYLYLTQVSCLPMNITTTLEFAVELAALLKYPAPREWQQADTVMLGYPLGLPMTPEVRRNDLEFYEAVTDPGGPAMTWVWSESSDGSGAVNFLTGMGGFLQAVLFGYTGFRVQKDCLAFTPLIPDDITQLCIRGVSYLGNKMDWLVRGQEVYIILREEAKHAGNTEPCALQVVLKNSGTKIPLIAGKPVTFPRESGTICKVDGALSCWPM
ncbi:unnamed protein product [Coregonus sp. 'balchen']|nr:unnamed protein product [Coregonus sp. 'balchen']